MKFCKVITNFHTDDFEKIYKTFDCDDVVFFTNNGLIHQKVKSYGYKIYEIGKYFPYGDPDLYSIHSQAVETVNHLINHLDDVKWNQVRIIDGLKSYILDRLIFLYKINHILIQEKANIIFLFDNTTYFYFSIPIIAKKIGYENTFGICTIENLGLTSLDFKQMFFSNYEFLSNHQQNIESKFNLDSIVSNYFNEIQNYKSQYGFFLINTDEDFYLKPVYPVLKKFNKGEYTIFTFYKKTSEQLLKKGFKTFDLSDKCDELEGIVIQQSKSIISKFFSILKKISTQDYVLDAYIYFFLNDRIVINTGRVIAIISLLENLIQRFRFKSILIAADGISENDIVCSIAKNHQIPTYSIPPGIMEFSPVLSILYNASKICVSGPRTKELLEKNHVSEERIVITGFPRFDYIISKSNKMKSFDKTYRKSILVAMSRIQENDEIWMPELIRFCNSNNYEIIIKLHPSNLYSDPEHRLSEEKIKKISEKCKDLKYNISYDEEISDLLSHTDILITDNSFVGMEAAFWDIPIIVTNRSSQVWRDNQNSVQYQKENVALYTSTVNELFHSLNRISNEDNLREYLRENRKKFNYEFNYKNDGNASERVFIAITDSK